MRQTGMQERIHIYEEIVMTGGGTAGHVTPNIALMPALKEADTISNTLAQ